MQCALPELRGSNMSTVKEEMNMWRLSQRVEHPAATWKLMGSTPRGLSIFFLKLFRLQNAYLWMHN